MSYQVLARKWRPQNFKQMVGQEHVLKALIHALESQRLHHAYLFTGTRGVGKTTIGRILAKCLSCHSGITSEPCGECGACNNISEGRYVDLIEIDAASRTKVEDMRELLDNVQYAPSEGRFKIYLIDEVHMLSQSSFNALLKTLEEPPEHVKFLFATTDPQKLPVTILSRCLQFNLKNMSPERIVSHLQNILSQETVQFEDMALWALARAADGSMRDALSLTDQAIAYGNQVLSEAGVSAMLGTVDQKKIYRILDCLIDRNAQKMLEEVKLLAEFSPNYGSVLANISEILHRVAIEQAVPGATDNSMGDKEQVTRYATCLCAEDVQLFYQVALVSRQDLAITPDPKTGLEMALLRMMAFQLSPSEQQQAPLDQPPRNNGENHVIEPASGAVETSSASPSNDCQIENTNSHAIESSSQLDHDSRAVQTVEDSVPQLSKPAPQLTETVSQLSENSEEVIHGDIDSGLAKKKADLEGENQVARTPESETLSESLEHVGASVHQAEAAELKQNKALTDSEFDKVKEMRLVDPSVESEEARVVVEAEGWNKDVAQLGLSGMTLNLVLNSVMEQVDDVVHLYFESGHYRLLNTSHEQRVIEGLKQFCGMDKEVVLHDGLLEGQETPMMWRERMRDELAREAKKNIQSDPNVIAMLDEFDGILLEHSIESLANIV